jgi:hypothetical protein
MIVFRPLICALTLGACLSLAQPSPSREAKATEEPTYLQDRNQSVPWSIHIVRVPRHSGAFEVHSVHGGGGAVGLGTVSDQAQSLSPASGQPVAAINGDFYQRQGAYVGHPRGLQIQEGELIAAPSGGASFWVDASGEPHTGKTASLLKVTWPDGTSAEIGLNEARRDDDIVLYTPAMGRSTHTRGGREFVLEPAGEAAWLPLAAGCVYVARVTQVRTAGNTPLGPKTLVLSVGPRAGTPQLSVGAEVKVSTSTSPSLRGVKTAISGGPVLVRAGKVQRVRTPDADSYEGASVMERHPRSAVGWNDNYLFLVEVDGRQRHLSVGMTLPELAAYMVKLGCTEAMNLDGGGSATLWYRGRVQNRPCDGEERLVANALVVEEKGGQSEQKATP